MDHATLIIISGAIVAGFIQGLSGFAFSMVALSFWAWVVDPRLAAAMAVFGSLMGQTLGALTVRRRFHFKQLLPFIMGGLVGIPLGVLILPQLNVHLFKVFLGLLLLIWCPIMLFSRQIPPISAGKRIADSIIGVIGGIMSAIGGFSGAVPTLWCTLRGFPKDEQRSLIQNFNFAILLVTMATYIAKGIVTISMLPMFAIVALSMLIPTLLGSRLYIGISEAMLRKIVLSMLTASGVALLSTSLPKLTLNFF
ncbi:MAG: sulfite exporter TauE/SafE family protein [Pseudomonadota bacterium]